jgi:hypothetical protein
MSEAPRPGLVARLFEPVDCASLVFLRVAFGVLMVWDFGQYLLGGRLQRFYVDPVFHFKYPGFEWVQVAPPAGMWALFIALVVLAGLIAAGAWYRFAAPLFALGYAYVFFLDEAAWNNHNYLILTLAILFALAPLGRGQVRPSLGRETVPRWVLWLFRFQIAMPYVWGGINKLIPDWLVRAEPMKLWLAEGTGGRLNLETSSAVGGYFFAWSGMIFDLLVVPLVLWPKTRKWAFISAVVFHLVNSQIFVIGVFPWLMIPATTIFLDPSWPRPWLARWRSTKRRKEAGTAAAPTLSVAKPVVAALALWVAFQLYLPLRHLAIPGWVDWTDEGTYFAWRMKLRDKRGEIAFKAKDPATGTTVALAEAQALLTPLQGKMMLHNPDMIRQFSRFLRDQLETKTGKRYEIHLDARISLNGRPAQVLIDPAVDLASEARKTPAPWILPLAALPSGDP